MFNFRKVKTMEDGNENKTQIKKDQANYENKVRALRTACDNFGKYLKKEVTEETKFLDIAKEFEGEKNGFGKQMKKSWLLSRTSRRLNEMKKNLLKSKNETFDPQNINDFVKCFEFEREKLNNKGNIKRSAIDDKKVYDFFNENSKGSIREILINRQTEAQKESDALNKHAKTVFDQVTKSLAKSKQARDIATGVQKEVEQILSNIKDKGIKEEDITTFDKQNGKLKECISALQQATQNLEKQQNQTNEDMDNKENTNGEKWTSLNVLCRAIGANDAATDKLNGAVDKAEEVHAEVKESIEEAQKKAKEESIELNKDAEIVFDQASTSVAESKQARAEATDVQKEIAQTRTSVKSDREIEPKAKRKSVNLLDVQTKNLGQDKSESQQAAQDLIEKQKETEKIMKDTNSTPRERRDSINALRQATVANNAATGKLNGAVDKAEDAHTEVQENIEEAKAKPFDSETKTFTVETEADFEKIKDFKNEIQKVVVGEGITNIKDKAFRSCDSLASIDLGNATTIGDAAFAYCTSLASVNLGSVTTIGNKAFWLCDSLASIDLGNVTTIGENAFFRCMSLGRLVSIDFKNVEIIKERAFSGCTSLGSIDLGKITTIEKSAFSGCKSLKSINLGNVQTIGDCAFLGTALTSINLGNVQTIGDKAFLGTALTSINLGNVTTIGKEAFSSCTSLGSINLGNVTTIGEEAFSSCTSLGSINFESVETIGEWAFSGCKSLKSINLGNVTTIGDHVFTLCTGIKKVILPQDGKKAKEIKDIICKQTGKTAGDGKTNNTIEFVNDPEPAAATQET